MGLGRTSRLRIIGDLQGQIEPGQTRQFTVELKTDRPVRLNERIQLRNNDATENPFDITFTGVVSEPARPAEVEVRVDGQLVSSASSELNYGAPTRSLRFADKRITIKNTGDATLKLSDFQVSGMQLLGRPGEIEGGQSVTLIARLNGGSLGFKSGSFSFRTSDASEPLYRFSSIGRILPKPLFKSPIIDDPYSPVYRINNSNATRIAVQPANGPALLLQHYELVEYIGDRVVSRIPFSAGLQRVEVVNAPLAKLIDWTGSVRIYRVSAGDATVRDQRVSPVGDGDTPAEEPLCEFPILLDVSAEQVILHRDEDASRESYAVFGEHVARTSFEVDAGVFANGAPIEPVVSVDAPRLEKADESDAVGESLGSTYYVDAVNGSDDNSGIAPDQAFQTWLPFVFAYGQDDANIGKIDLGPGDVVEFLPGTYSATYKNPSETPYRGFDLRGVHGTEEHPIIIKGRPGVVFDAVPPDGSESITSSIHDVSHLRIEDIEFTGLGAGIYLTSSENVTVVGNWFHDVDGTDNSNIAGIVLAGNADVDIYDNLFNDNYDRTNADTDGRKTANSRHVVAFRNHGFVRFHHNTLLNTPTTDALVTGRRGRRKARRRRAIRGRSQLHRQRLGRLHRHGVARQQRSPQPYHRQRGALGAKLRRADPHQRHRIRQ